MIGAAMPRRFELLRTLPPPSITAEFLADLEDGLRVVASQTGCPIQYVELSIVDSEGIEFFDSAHDDAVTIRLPNSHAVGLILQGRDDELKLELSLESPASGLEVEIATTGSRAREDALLLFEHIQSRARSSIQSGKDDRPEEFSAGRLMLRSLYFTPAAFNIIREHLVEKAARFVGVEPGVPDDTITLSTNGGRIVRTMSVRELHRSKFPDDIHEFTIKVKCAAIHRSTTIEAQFGQKRHSTFLSVTAVGPDSEAFAHGLHQSLVRTMKQFSAGNGLFHPTSGMSLLFVPTWVFILIFAETVDSPVVLRLLLIVGALTFIYPFVSRLLPFTVFDNIKIKNRMRAIRWAGLTVLTISLGAILQPIIEGFFST